MWCVKGVNLRLAVSAPRSVELDEDILVLVHDDLLVGVGDDDGDWAVIRLWDSLGLDTRSNVTGDDTLNELGDVLLGELLLLVEGVLLVGNSVLDGEGRELLRDKVEVGSVSTKGLGVDGSEVDLAL